MEERIGLCDSGNSQGTLWGLLRRFLVVPAVSPGQLVSLEGTVPPGHAALSCNFYAVSGGSEVKLRYWFVECVPWTLPQQGSHQPLLACRSVAEAWLFVLMLSIREQFGERLISELVWSNSKTPVFGMLIPKYNITNTSHWKKADGRATPME